MGANWITWIIQTLVGLGVGGLAWFMKRTLTQIDDRIGKQDERINELQEKQDARINELQEKQDARINELQEKQNARIDQLQEKHEERIDNLQHDIQIFVNNMPLTYTLREDFLRTVAKMDSKQDKILDKLSELAVSVSGIKGKEEKP